MAIPKFEVDMNIMSKVPMYPSDGGFTPEGFRAEFDKGGKLLQEYINTILLPKLDVTMDPDALVSEAQKQLEVIFSAEMVKYFVKVMQLDDCVLNTGYKFRASKLSDTLLNVYGGEAVIQGHIVTMDMNEPVSIAVAAGTHGTYRNDLICLRFTRAEDGTESNSIVYLQGNTTQTSAADPAYLQNDINVLKAVSTDFPLYRIRVQNTTATVEQLFTVVDGFLDMLANDSSIWEGGSY